MQEQRTQSLSRDLYQNIIFILLLLAASVEVLGELLHDTGQKSKHMSLLSLLQSETDIPSFYLPGYAGSLENTVMGEPLSSAHHQLQHFCCGCPCFVFAYNFVLTNV